MAWPKTWSLWEVRSEFKQDGRAMLAIACPECGTEYAIRKSRYRDYRSCNKCRFVVQNRDNLGKHRGVGDLTKTFYNYFRFGARRRGLDFEMSIAELWELAVKQEFKCALSGLQIVFPTIRNADGAMALDANAMQRLRTGAGRVEVASLDRIDSSKGYIPGNVQWVTKHINLMKNALSSEDFIHICHLVASLHANPEPSRLNWFPMGRVGRKVQRTEGEGPDPITPPRAPNTPRAQAQGDDMFRYSGESRRVGD